MCLIGLWNWFIGRMMPQASGAGHGVQGLLFGLLGFGLAVVQSSLVFPDFSFGLGMLSLCCCLEGFCYRSPRTLSADLMGHFEGTLEAQNADSRGLVIRFLEATQSRNRLFSLFVLYYGKKKIWLNSACVLKI